MLDAKDFAKHAPLFLLIVRHAFRDKRTIYFYMEQVNAFPVARLHILCSNRYVYNVYLHAKLVK